MNALYYACINQKMQKNAFNVACIRYCYYICIIKLKKYYANKNQDPAYVAGDG